MANVQRDGEGYVLLRVRQHAHRRKRCFVRGCLRAYLDKRWNLPSNPTYVIRFIADLLGRTSRLGASSHCKVLAPHINPLRIIGARERTFHFKCIRVRVGKVRPRIALEAWRNILVEDDFPTIEREDGVHRQRSNDDEVRPSFLSRNPHVLCLLRSVPDAKGEDPCTMEQIASEAKARQGVWILFDGRTRMKGAMSSSAIHDDMIRSKNVADSFAHT